MMPTSWKLTGDQKPTDRWGHLLILSLLMSFASISTDLYLPAIPAMQKAFNANPGDMEFTISSYLVGFSIGQLVWGPISDRFGRRLPIMIGLVFFIIGSAGCAFANNMHLLIASRVVQALYYQESWCMTFMLGPWLPA